MDGAGGKNGGEVRKVGLAWGGEICMRIGASKTILTQMRDRSHARQPVQRQLRMSAFAKFILIKLNLIIGIHGK